MKHIQDLICEKGQILALLCFVKFWAKNPISVYVNEKFCNKNLFLDLFGVVLIVFQILYCLHNVYRGSSMEFTAIG